MGLLGDRFNRLTGKTRYMVCRIFLHLRGQEVAPLLGVLNQASRSAIAAEGDLAILGECLVEICENLLQQKLYWQSAANEGDVFWNEGEAGEYINELFTDSSQRYLADADLGGVGENEPLTLPVTENLIVMIAVAIEGEVPELETDLASIPAMEDGLKTLINLNYQNRYRAIQVHFSPAKLGDELTSEQLILNFPELIPL